MISIKIEKEIKHENKLLGPLTARQTVVVGLAAVIGFIVWGVTRIPVSQLLPVFVVLGVFAGIFGWVKKDGLHAEDLLIKRIKQAVYHNQRLRYRTVNQYVKAYNQGYSKKRAVSPKRKKKKVPRSTMKIYL